MKRTLQILIHLAIVLPVMAVAAVVEIRGESVGLLQNILLPLLATGICLQQPSGVIAAVFVGIGLVGEACGSLPIGTSAVSSAMGGLICLNVLREQRIPWIWRGTLNVFCVCGVQVLIGELATAIRSSGGKAIVPAFQHAIQLAAIAAGLWLLVTILVAGVSAALSFPMNRRTEIELR
ncbi:hypothetical protein [Rubinisphaera margarita]|uniref:hypothetical protein n=1 Tax=Rubinisphaera margarita TaxID=2909586 RepID=UPI001EE8B263|nr:hypothetical protein [Rubinisphaera margarita]MCG6156649.1 hypothetical protein [Rubinisphaera margarita]